jgi:hypothetical protein
MFVHKSDRASEKDPKDAVGTKISQGERPGAGFRRNVPGAAGTRRVNH